MKLIDNCENRTENQCRRRIYLDKKPTLNLFLQHKIKSKFCHLYFFTGVITLQLKTKRTTRAHS